MAKFRPLPPLVELREKFDYDPETGLFFHKKLGRGTNKGRAAGGKCGKYVSLSHKGCYYRAHRVAWLLMTGEDPFPYEVDHEDRNPSNNKFSNLRLATHKQNMDNKVCRGYYYNKNAKKYVAEIVHNGVYIYLGLFSEAAEAQRAYDAKAVELRGEFAPQAWRQGSA